MKKLVCLFCSFFMGMGLIFADDGAIYGNQPKSSSSDKEFNLVKQSKGVLIRVPVKDGVELANLAQMRLVDSSLDQSSDVNSAWNKGVATSYRPFVSEEEIASTEDSESLEQTCLFRRCCYRPWSGVYYYSVPRYAPVVWRPAYYRPTYTYYSTSYSYSYSYSWSTPYYNTYYYSSCW